MAKTPTMWDVARAAGVSQATVSLVIGGDSGSRVSKATAKRVLEAIQATGYRHNLTAKALREGVAEMVGLIGDHVASSPFAGQIIEGAQDRAWVDGHLLLVSDTGGAPQVEHAAIEQMLSHQLRRFVYAFMYNQHVEVPEALRGADVVVLNALEATQTCWSVAPDEKQGGYDAVSHLVSHGHRRIGMINIESLESGLPAALGRYDGYLQALQDNGLEFDPSLVRFGAGATPDGYEHTKALMGQPDRPTALFCANDRTAWGAYQALSELGLDVPGDVSVVGFDNQDVLAPSMRPGLTTMNLPFREMGWAATDLLLTGAAGESTTSAEPGERTLLLRCELIERESVSVPRRSE